MKEAHRVLLAWFTALPLSQRPYWMWEKETSNLMGVLSILCLYTMQRKCITSTCLSDCPCGCQILLAFPGKRIFLPTANENNSGSTFMESLLGLSGFFLHKTRGMKLGGKCPSFYQSSILSSSFQCRLWGNFHHRRLPWAPPPSSSEYSSPECHQLWDCKTPL